MSGDRPPVLWRCFLLPRPARMAKVKTSHPEVVLLLAALAGCESDAELLDSKQDMAIKTALARGQFEMNCAQATPAVLSREAVEPSVTGVYGSQWVPMAEYTIGVSGCGKRMTYFVTCPQGGDSCSAVVPK